MTAPLPEREAADEPRTATAGEPDAPRRVLVVSADMGGGHNATADALEEAVERRWPGSEVRRVDTLDVMGPGVGALFRRIYVSNVEATPWLYEFFYASLWRHRWFARASKRVTGSWCGRRLAAPVDRFDPDLILSTYPLGSSGLAWLRTHRGLAVPTGCWISDFAPHPFWVYGELDANFVMHQAAAPVARAAEPGARVEVSPLPVVSRFRPGDRDAARADLGLRRDSLVVLVSCGSYAFGDTAAMVRTLCEAAGNVVVLAVCGRDGVALDRLCGLGLPEDTLRVFGWVEDMAALTRAADLVLTNAGGATALEALASAVPVLSAVPIAAHGTANADLMTVAGLGELCSDLDGLGNLVARIAADPTSLQPLRARVGALRDGPRLDEAVGALADGTIPTRTPDRVWPMRPADSFFARLDSASAPQEVGAVLEIDRTLDGSPLTAARLRRTLQPRMAGLAVARRVLVRHPLGWRLVDPIDVSDHVGEVELPGARSSDDLWDAVSRLWAEPLPEGRPGWKMLVVRSPSLQHSLVGVKLHHALADGISALGLLDRLLETATGDPLRERRPTPGHDGTHLDPVHVAGGLVSLATRGSAPRHRLNRSGGGAPTLVGASLPWAEVRRVAKLLGVRPHELLIGLVADVLATLLDRADLLTHGEPLRAMVPVAMRPARLDRTFGNWTGSVALDLPTGPMAPAERVAAVASEMRRRVGRGEPSGAAAVMLLAGRLPGPLHRWFAHTVYGPRFFNTIVSYMPAARGPRWVHDAPVRLTVPVLPLAPGIPVTVGIIVADRVVGLGVLLDDALGLPREAVGSAVRDSFAAVGGRALAVVDEPQDG